MFGVCDEVGTLSYAEAAGCSPWTIVVLSLSSLRPTTGAGSTFFDLSGNRDGIRTRLGFAIEVAQN
jgi:hypothetical protein